RLRDHRPSRPAPCRQRQAALHRRARRRRPRRPRRRLRTRARPPAQDPRPRLRARRRFAVIGAAVPLPLQQFNVAQFTHSRHEERARMSEAASVPFSETKAPESPDRLHKGALRLIDISASTMANIGPAYSFYFSFGLIVVTAGIAAPLTIVAAIVAIALLANTLAQFSRAQPSTGGFITFVGKTFGGTSAVTTALLCGAGYIIAISSVLVISGGFLSIMLNYYLG